MCRIARLAVTVLAVVGVVPVFPAAQSGNPWVGSWRLNVQKSTYSPGPPPKSQTRTYEDRGEAGMLITLQGVNAQGNPTLQQMAFKVDGKEYPLAQLNATALSTVAQRRIDSHTVELTFRVGGKITTTATEAISKAGKTMTFTQKGTNAQGQPVNSVVILEKQ
jgi:hypothetical protein